ncbi:MAG: methionyl-tRNA formyltransferase [Candidatus Sungbacteria bacterium]|uniref:Methionyl-tRNA formyltransferase n=1 Tax=Candidatus Sungiibacteriota bacterium TaxID=2750080 RepID=A0A9D6LRN4_9BACT|nr:methionyl-tRNA formyltransferase [Candidatus Sungbacteria bacterium]
MPNFSIVPRILFWGTPEFAVPVLKRLLDEKYNVIGVVTNPDRAWGRSKTPGPSPVKICALRHNIPVLQPETLKDPGFVKALREHDPDCFIVVAYGKIIPDEILRIAKRGALNVHPALLPRWRGPSPIETAILQGENMTGVSLMELDQQMDHGPIIAREEVSIQKDETALALSAKLSLVGARMLVRFLPDYLSGKAKPHPQNDAEATFSKILTKEDGHLLWDRPATMLERQIRAFIRWPESYCFWQRGENSIRLKIEKAEVLPKTQETKPLGTVYETKLSPLTVETIDGALGVLALTPEAKSSMSAAEFIRGHPEIIGAELV